MVRSTGENNKNNSLPDTRSAKILLYPVYNLFSPTLPGFGGQGQHFCLDFHDDGDCITPLTHVKKISGTVDIACISRCPKSAQRVQKLLLNGRI